MEYKFIGSFKYIEDLANIDIRDYPYNNPVRRLMAIVIYNCENESINDHIDNPDYAVYIYSHEYGKWILSPIDAKNDPNFTNIINKSTTGISSIKLDTEYLIKALNSSIKKYKNQKKKIDNATKIICIKISVSIILSLIIGGGGVILLYEIISSLFR